MLLFECALWLSLRRSELSELALVSYWEVSDCLLKCSDCIIGVFLDFPMVPELYGALDDLAIQEDVVNLLDEVVLILVSDGFLGVVVHFLFIYSNRPA